MKNITRLTSFGLLATMATAALAPVAALADDNHQGKKNTGRNVGIGGAALLGYGLLKHNTTATVLGAVGAGVGAKMYEDNRKAQSRNNARYHRHHYYYRNGHRYYRSY